MTYFGISYFEIGEPEVFKLLKLIYGTYGLQYIVETPREGKGYLTNAEDLMMKLKNRSIGECVEIILLSRGQRFINKSIFKVYSYPCSSFEKTKNFYNNREYYRKKYYL